MAKKKIRRAGHKHGSSWKKGNTVERRSTIGLGFLNVDGWSDVTRDDVETAMEAQNIDVFSFVETDAKKKSGESRPKVSVRGCKVFEVCRQDKFDRLGGGIAVAVKQTTGVVVNLVFCLTLLWVILW